LVRILGSEGPDGARASARRRRPCRLNPFDPRTSRHLGQCEFIGETDAGILRVLLKITDKGDYDWVECGGCGAGWQVPHYAESVA